MDGVPYLWKVDLKTYTAYQELSSAPSKLFSCFTIGQCGSHGASRREVISESKLRDLLHGYEYVLTYKDKDPLSLAKKCMQMTPAELREECGSIVKMLQRVLPFCIDVFSIVYAHGQI